MTTTTTARGLGEGTEEGGQRPLCTDNTISLSRHVRPLIRDSLALVLSNMPPPPPSALHAVPFPKVSASRSLAMLAFRSAPSQLIRRSDSVLRYSRPLRGRAACRIARQPSKSRREDPWGYTAFQGRAIRVARGRSLTLSDGEGETQHGVSRPQR